MTHGLSRERKAILGFAISARNLSRTHDQAQKRGQNQDLTPNSSPRTWVVAGMSRKQA